MQEFLHTANERPQLPQPLYLTSLPRINNAGMIPQFVNPSPGTILTYDGRPIYVTDPAGINFRSHSERRTSSTSSKSKYAVPRQNAQPQYFQQPENSYQISLEQVKNSTYSPALGTAEQRVYQVPSVLAESQVSSRVGVASGKRSHVVLKPSNMEIIPNHDVTMVFVKGTDEKELELELPRILHQLGQQADNDERESKTTQGEVSSGSLELSPENFEQLSRNGYKVSDAFGYGKVNIDNAI